MSQRGRKSSAELAIAPVVEIDPRLPPPGELSEFEAALWISIVNTKPAEWFRADTAQMLVAYCRHCSQAALVDAELEKFEPTWLRDPEGLARYKALTDIREKQTRAIASLSRGMRLSQQSQYDALKASRRNKDVATNKRPWEQS